MDVFVRGKNRIVLTQADFCSSGGEGDVYIKGQTAYKIYHDPAATLPAAKIQELSPLSAADIIRPLETLVNAGGASIGYSMRAIPTGIPLIQTFTKAFRERTGLTPQKVMPLVARLRDGVKHVHDCGILIVDLNEMNFLVDPGFQSLYFIDVDSYQTRSFKAHVLMESVRDRHCPSGQWDEGTDWFSFGLVSFQMFTGIHPFKGTHPTLKTLDERMLANASVLNPGVRVPAATLPFTVIPANFLDWYRAIFNRGMRVPPPMNFTEVLVLTPVFKVKHQSGSNQFDIEEVQEYEDGEVVRVYPGFTLTTEALYQGTRRIADAPPGAHLAVTATLGHAILGWLDGQQLRLQDATLRQDIPTLLQAEALMSHEGRLILKQKDRLQEIEFLEVGSRIVAGVRHIGNALENATQLFEGVAFQNLLGTCYASLFPRPFTCQQIRLRELEGYRIIDARIEGRVMMVVGEKQGKYDLFIFRFTPDGTAYDMRRIRDITYTGINFTVLDNGICVHMNPAEVLELFQAVKDAPALREIDDPVVRGDIRLFKNGTQTLFARGNRLYQISLRKTATA